MDIKLLFFFGVMGYASNSIVEFQLVLVSWQTKYACLHSWMFLYGFVDGDISKISKFWKRYKEHR